MLNSHQGSQFTSVAITKVLKREAIAISMDGRGRTYNNVLVERLWKRVKHENRYLNGYATMGYLVVGPTKHFAFNTERPHQALGTQIRQEVHKTPSGGGNVSVDKYRSKERFPVVPHYSGVAAEEVGIEGESVT